MADSVSKSDQDLSDPTVTIMWDTNFCEWFIFNKNPALITFIREEGSSEWEFHTDDTILLDSLQNCEGVQVFLTNFIKDKISNQFTADGVVDPDIFLSLSVPVQELCEKNPALEYTSSKKYYDIVKDFMYNVQGKNGITIKFSEFEKVFDEYEGPEKEHYEVLLTQEKLQEMCSKETIVREDSDTVQLFLSQHCMLGLIVFELKEGTWKVNTDVSTDIKFSMHYNKNKELRKDCAHLLEKFIESEDSHDNLFTMQGKLIISCSHILSSVFPKYCSDSKKLVEKISDENFSTVARGNEKLSDQLQEDEEEKGEKETPDLSRDKEGFRWMSFSDAMYKASKNTYSERLGRMPLDTVVVRKAYRKKQVFVECTQEESEAYARSTTAND